MNLCVQHDTRQNVKMYMESRKKGNKFLHICFLIPLLYHFVTNSDDLCTSLRGKCVSKTSEEQMYRDRYTANNGSAMICRSVISVSMCANENTGKMAIL